MSQDRLLPPDFALLQDYIDVDETGIKDKADPPPKKRMNSRKKKTYNLAPEIIDGVKEIALLERFGPKQISPVVEAFLRHAISEYKDGRIGLEMTLHGEPGKETIRAEVVKNEF